MDRTASFDPVPSPPERFEAPDALPVGGGEIGALVRAHDWSSYRPGAPAT